MDLLKKRYGQNAGNPRGAPYDPDRCVEEVWTNFYARQCARKKGHGKDGLYCKQHGKKHDA